MTIALSAACETSAPIVDATVDVRADSVALDTITDAQRDTACFEGDRDFLAPDPGFSCTPRAGMAGRVTCLTERVCDPAECPEGCEACQKPNVCVPDQEGAVCASRYACSPDGCSEGCRAIG